LPSGTRTEVDKQRPRSIKSNDKRFQRSKKQSGSGGLATSIELSNSNMLDSGWRLTVSSQRTLVGVLSHDDHNDLEATRFTFDVAS
jgi:hypothetical protein